MEPLVEEMEREEVERLARPSTPPPTSRRSRRARSRSIRIARASHREARLALEQAEALEREIDRPHKRSECADGPRPCPHVSCRLVHLDAIDETIQNSGSPSNST